MIERELILERTATPSVLNPIYKILIILLLLKNKRSEKGVKISRIQVYLWGMNGNRNKQTLSDYLKKGCIGELPITPDPELINLLADAEVRGWIESVKDGKTYMRYKLTLQGEAVLLQLKTFAIYTEIKKGLDDIGYLPDSKTDTINYVWTYDVF